jgi:soluble cytochrome b562
VLIGIIALVALLASNTKTAAEEMAELDSQTKALADAADKAEESMQNLADTQKDLANLKNTMDGLVKGTDEWNKALI